MREKTNSVLQENHKTKYHISQVKIHRVILHGLITLAMRVPLTLEDRLKKAFGFWEYGTGDSWTF